MNAFKVVVATACLVLVCPWLPKGHLSPHSLASFLTSGAIGLAIADLFILRAFSQLGSTRTLILFGFQPLIIAMLNWLIYSQSLTSSQLCAVVFLIGALIIFSLENKQVTGSWHVKSILIALTGICFDAVGVLITRSAFQHSPDFHVLHGHLIRCFGAIIVFICLHFFITKIPLVSVFKELPAPSRLRVVFGSFMGTFLSLCFYLTAIKLGNISTLSSVAITGPLFAGVFECLQQRKWPSNYLLLATSFFVIGFSLLTGLFSVSSL